MKFVITGAGFGNMGAQAMMYIVACELKTRFEGCEVVVANSSKLPTNRNGELNFRYVETGLSELYVLAPFKMRYALIKSQILCKLKGIKTASLHAFERESKSADAIIDISGFALGDQWSDVNCLSFLSRIEIARKHHVKIILMPQSFGPFNYEGENSQLISAKTKELLEYPYRIYAREEEGYELLKNTYGLTNVVLSPDLVLQSKVDSWQGALINYEPSKLVNTIQQNSIAIIPNAHCYDYAGSRLIDMYTVVVNQLLDLGETVYLVRHSKADYGVCVMIKERYKDDSRVILLSELKDCFEFSEIVTRFKFIIASRYHSIVHAYKKGIPCIALGWAIKYKELLTLMGQERYFVDIRSLVGDDDVKTLVEVMESQSETENKKILNSLALVQSNNVFDDLENILKK